MRTIQRIQRVFIASAFLCLLSCSTSEAEDEQMIDDPTPANAVPIMADQQFDVAEDVGGFQTIANLQASDADGDELTFRLESDIDLSIVGSTGAITTRANSILDYETAQSFTFEVSARDGKGGITTATVTINVVDVDDGPLTNFQKSFVSEYIYLTYKLSPTASGSALSEKWQGQVRLFLDGDLPSNYSQTVNGYLEEFNSFFTDGTTIELVNSQAESDIHLIMGPTSSVQAEWPDMFSQISGGNFSGYALYNTNGNFNIFRGRIWMNGPSAALFKHELGHIIGLGHTSDTYCDGEATSVMCSAATANFNPFDREIIKTLYRPDTPVALSQNEMRALVTAYLEQGDIVF